METKVCHMIKIWTSFQKKLNSGLLVQEEHGFQKGAQCAPCPQEQKKKPGLDKVKRWQNHLEVCCGMQCWLKTVEDSTNQLV